MSIKRGDVKIVKIIF